MPSSRNCSASAVLPARRLVDPLSSHARRFCGYRPRSVASCDSAASVLLLAVVQDDEREARFLLVVADVGRRALDQLQALFAPAAEPDHVGRPAQRHGQRRDDIAVGADDEAGVLAAGVDLEDFLVFVVGFAGGLEGAERAAVDRGRVRARRPMAAPTS